MTCPDPNLRFKRFGPFVRATVDNPAFGDERMMYPQLSFWGIGEYMASQRALRWWDRKALERERYQLYVDRIKERFKGQ